MFQQIWPHLRAYKKQLIIGPFFKLLEAVFELTIPIFMSMLIDNGIAKGDHGYILRTGGLMLLLIACGLCCALVCQYSASVASQGVGTSLRRVMFQKISSLSYAQIDRLGTGSLTNRLTADINQLQVAVAMLIRLVIRAPFIVIGSVVASMMIDIKMSVIFMIAMPVFIVILFLITRYTFPLYKKVQKRLDALSVNLREYLSGIRVIRAFSRTDYEKQRFDDNTDAFQKASIRVGRISVLLGPATMLVMNAGIIAILWFSGIRVQAGQLSQGQILAFINYMTQVLMTLIVVANLITIFTRASASLARVNEVLEQTPSITDGPLDIVPESQTAVRFEGVCFGYHTGAQQLQALSFTLQTGQTMGIIGVTGSGKSTLINLIPRFYDVSAGRVLFFGKDVRDYRLAALRGAIGIVPQQSRLFSGTVLENLVIGSNATLQDAQQAAQLACADDFIRQMDGGYQARVEKGGVNLSGGQRQRMCIARALARRPKLLVLDDSLSALDLKTDAQVRAGLRNLGVTTVIVSQRIAAIKNCDLILLLDHGQNAGLGTHAQLVAENETYREICRSQNMLGGAQDEK